MHFLIARDSGLAIAVRKRNLEIRTYLSGQLLRRHRLGNRAYSICLLSLLRIHQPRSVGDRDILLGCRGVWLRYFACLELWDVVAFVELDGFLRL